MHTIKYRYLRLELLELRAHFSSLITTWLSDFNRDYGTFNIDSHNSQDPKIELQALLTYTSLLFTNATKFPLNDAFLNATK